MRKMIRHMAGLCLVVAILLMLAFPAMAYKIHRIGPGDNIQKIAVWYGVSTESLIQTNHLANPGYIVPGQVLLIPEPSIKVDERVYEVKLGDTLSKIAQKYEVSLDWLFQRNNLNANSRIYAGQMIRIPAPDTGQAGGTNSKQAYVYNIPDLMKRHPGYVFLKGSTTEKKVALTFDDGPDSRFTPLILDELGKLGVKATFFLMGKRIPGNEWVVTRMIREGHIIGNHTYNHLNLRKMGTTAIATEITKTDDAIQKIIHKQPTLVRPPYGEMSEAGLDWMVDHGYRMINWSVDSGDWRVGSSDQVLVNVLPQVQPGSIILFHSAGGTGEDLTPTVKAISELVTTLRGLGYQIVPLPELIGLPAYQ